MSKCRYRHRIQSAARWLSGAGGCNPAQLLETVWEAQPDIQTRTVDMHVQRLRGKLRDVGDMIETIRGFGYRFRSSGK